MQLTERLRSLTRRPALVAAALGLLALLLYLATLAPDIPPTDSGELILAAWLPGIAHAPGFPLWVVLGWLFSHLLPLGSVAQRLNAMSAVWGAAAVGMTFVMLRQAFLPETAPGRRSDANAAAALGAIGIPAAVALTFAFSRTHWSWSVVAEVYSLHTFLVVAICWLLLKWRQTWPAEPNRLRAGRWLLGAALLYGLALGNHNLTIGLLAPAILFWLWRNRRGLDLRLIALCALALGLGALIHLYLPLRAAQEPLLNWGDPHNWQRLWWHITGKQYQVNIFGGTLAGMANELGAGLLLWAQQFTPLAVPLLLGGLWALWRRDRPLAIFSLLVVFFGVAYAVVYEIADDRDAYYLATFVMSTLWLAAAWHALSARLAAPNSPQAISNSPVPARKPSAAAAKKAPASVQESAPAPQARRSPLLPLLLLLLPLITIIFNWRVADHRHYLYPTVYAQNALHEVGPNALLLTGDWQLYAPLLTMQWVENQRPDVTVIDVQLFQNRPWYHRQLALRAPGLLTPFAGEEENFLVKLRQFEADELPAGDVEISPRYTALWQALLRSAWAERPIYATPDVINHLRQFGIELSNQATPGDILLRLWPAPLANPAPLPPLTWNIAPFTDAISANRHLDEPARKIQRVHATMAVNRSAYHTRLGDAAAAMGDLQAAVAVEPTMLLAHLLLADLQQRQGDIAGARRSLQTALALDPNNIQVQQRLTALPAP